MDPGEISTKFASATRDAGDALQTLHAELKSIPLLQHLLDAFPTPALILNKHRQVILHNRAFEQIIPMVQPGNILGARAGELINCIHNRTEPGGCGSSSACRFCGAIDSVLQAQQGEPTTRDARITVDTDDGPQSLDFRVFGIPLNLNGSDLVVTSLLDISNENRRRVLERTFFHDLMNTTNGLQALSELLRIGPPEERDALIHDLQGVTQQLIGEIEMQRDLLAAERDDLQLQMMETTTDEMLSHIMALYRYHHLTQSRSLHCINHAKGETLITDATLLARCLGNMVKNALEASADGETVTLSCEEADPDKLHFHVHNLAVMPEHVRMQVFQRSFSTKGLGRGIGTYSARLLVERFLNGKVSFTSIPGEGTLFTISLPKQLTPEI